MKNILSLLCICCFLTTIYASANSEREAINSIKNSNLNTDVVKKVVVDTRPKYRIGFDAPQINHRQLLLTIDQRATDGVDWGFDGNIPQVLADDMYWLINEGKYVIQATNTLEVNKEFALGVVTKVGGDITIKIDALEYPMDDFIVGLKDKALDSIHNLKESSYQVTLPAGEYHNRFSIIFLSIIEDVVLPPAPPGDTIAVVENETVIEEPVIVEDVKNNVVAEESNVVENETATLSDGDENYEDNLDGKSNKQKLIIYVNNGQHMLTIKNRELLKLRKVTLFNINGQQVCNWNKDLDSENIYLPLQVKSDLYFVVAETQKGPVFKRVMVQNN
ncbi:T9SS C-terminal target domain-containing protein [Lutibacter sp. HS1-25]|uniref:T9SS type A sorting domain-containing protein n=1 Tax=Lutibacter sp. HS1-25 TaxID=2485000 RepID=UPI0010139716|nr:T9SS type A sorting domain-containing protein [Lutibacter sp. HS1-25]RXP49317.1 T9SS C-terminal target domain-containing protein [Lutibacter sp. HS1-25]